MIQRPLDGYAFPVFTTGICPRNLTEWQERSSAFNCNQTNAYMCVPDENITELLEFCYSLPQIRIVKGIYTCLNFTACFHNISRMYSKDTVIYTLTSMLNTNMINKGRYELFMYHARKRVIINSQFST